MKTEENKKQEELNDEQLDNVAAGGVPPLERFWKGDQGGNDL